MKKEVEKICKKIDRESTVSNITMTFTSPKFPEYKVYLCREINAMTIHQDLVRNITDKIVVELLMERDPYIGMLYMRKNMFCQLEITYFKPSEVADDIQYKRKPDISKKYKVAVTKFEDLFKKLSTEQLFPEKRRENDGDRKTYLMSVEMIEEDVYKARKEALYFTGRDTNMYDMMRYCCNYFGYKKAYLAKPDNTRKYSNFVIPPAYHVEEIFGFLQNSPGLGVYKDGLISYITEGAWYVYPRYGEPVNKKPINVYCLGGNKYIGLNKNDIQEGALTKILSQSEMDEINWTNVGSENEPTSYVAQMTDLLVDASRTLVSDKKCLLERRNHYPTVVPSDIMDYDNFIRIKHVKSYGNLYKVCSDARAMQCRTLRFQWYHARPWVFHPATIVTVYYDEKGKMEKHIGMCEKATFTYKKDPNSRILPLFTCDAVIEVCCSIREKGLVQSLR